MIGLIDLDGHGLSRAGVEGSGRAFRRIDPQDAGRALMSSEIHALVVEAESLDARARELLGAAQERSCPTLFITRERSVSGAVEALRAGATDCLVAPFEFDSFERALARLSGPPSPPVRHGDPDEFVTADPAMRETIEMTRSLAASDATILVEGESGTGKELIAQLVHRASPRSNRELVSVNCAALPAGLLESELFGHERGAFTGAVARSIGKFELAHGTTILLDEIGELELPLQAKLLRVIQEKQVQRIGAHRPVNVDFRLVATTNRNLANEARAGRFREDLFFRLNVLPVRLKPLRERPGDVALLLAHFARKHLRPERPAPIFPRATLDALEGHDWPGNVRELENLVERLTLTCAGREVGVEHLDFQPKLSQAASAIEPATSTDLRVPAFETIREMERWLIVETLRGMSGNRTRAAQRLGISLRTLRNKIREYAIDDPDTLPRTGTARSAARQLVPGEA